MASVLIVDDTATIRSIIRIYLMGMQLEFVEAERGDQALDILKGRNFDLIIADVRMPGIDGLEFTRAVRAHPRSEVRNAPVILLTFDKSDETFRLGREAGASAFIHKPVGIENLRSTVQQFLPGAKPQP